MGSWLRPLDMVQALARATIRRMPRGVGRRPLGRVLVSGSVLAVGLVLSSWLVTPGPHVDGTFLRFLALNTTCELLLWGAIVMVTGRVLSASVLFGLLVALVVVINNLRYQYTGTVALPVDVYAVIGSLRDFGLFLGYVRYHVKELLVLTVLSGLTVVGFVSERSIFPWSWRPVVARLVYLAVTVWLFHPLMSTHAPIRRVYGAMGAEFDGQTPKDTVVTAGLFAHLLMAIPAFASTFPEDFGDASLFRTYYESNLAADDTPDARPKVLPNIVVVLSESLFDPRRLRLTIEPEILTTWDRVSAESDYHGLLRVHTVGGGTVRAEYTFLTGMPTSILGPAGTWPFYSLVSESSRSLATYLKALGYRTVVIYPVSGSLFNARDAYSLLGFDEIIDQIDLGPPAGSGYVSDAAIAEQIVETVRGSDGPVFVFALTMETHGPYSFEASAQERRFRVDGDMRADLLDIIEGYVHRLPHVEALVSTVHDYLEEQARPYVFGMFGDHLPAMFEVFDEVGFTRDASANGDPRYETPYFVVGNARPDREPQAVWTDIGFLGSLVLDAADLNHDEFFRMNFAYREFCGGTFQSCRQGDEFMRSYVQILYDDLREQAREDRAEMTLAHWSLLPRYRLGDPVEEGSEYYGGGWAAERWGAWSIGASSHINMRLEEMADADVVLHATVRPFRTVDSVRVSVNDELVDTWEFPERRERQAWATVIPDRLIPRDGTVRLRLDVSNPGSPREMGDGEDSRQLGLAVYELRLCATSDRACGPWYRLGDVVRVGGEYSGAGWDAESWGAWSIGAFSYITMQLEQAPGTDVVLHATVQPFRTVDSVRLSVNGQPVDTWEFATKRGRQARTTVIPARLIPRDGIVRLRVDVSSPGSPKALGEGEDNRPLGMAVYDLQLCATSDRTCGAVAAVND